MQLLTFKIGSFNHLTYQSVLPKRCYSDREKDKYHSDDSSWQCCTVLWQYRESLYNLNSKRKLKGKGWANIIQLENIIINERCKLVQCIQDVSYQGLHSLTINISISLKVKA